MHDIVELFLGTAAWMWAVHNERFWMYQKCVRAGVQALGVGDLVHAKAPKAHVMIGSCDTVHDDPRFIPGMWDRASAFG